MCHVAAALLKQLTMQSELLKVTETLFISYCRTMKISEVESSRTSLASRTSSRTHFEVLSLGLEASSPRKLPCPRLEDSTIFEPLKFRWKTSETLRKICKDLFLVSSCRDRLKKNFEDLFFENTCVCVLGSWPREGLSLASKFFCVLGLGLEPCVLDSTSGKYVVTAGALLKSLYPKLFHVACVAHLLHNCVMKVRFHFKGVDKVIAKVDLVTVKSKPDKPN